MSLSRHTLRLPFTGPDVFETLLDQVCSVGEMWLYTESRDGILYGSHAYSDNMDKIVSRLRAVRDDHGIPSYK